MWKLPLTDSRSSASNLGATFGALEDPFLLETASSYLRGVGQEALGLLGQDEREAGRPCPQQPTCAMPPGTWTRRCPRRTPMHPAWPEEWSATRCRSLRRAIPDVSQRTGQRIPWSSTYRSRRRSCPPGSPPHPSTEGRSRRWRRGPSGCPAGPCSPRPSRRRSCSSARSRPC